MKIGVCVVADDVIRTLNGTDALQQHYRVTTEQNVVSITPQDDCDVARSTPCHRYFSAADGHNERVFDEVVHPVVSQVVTGQRVEGCIVVDGPQVAKYHVMLDPATGVLPRLFAMLVQCDVEIDVGLVEIDVGDTLVDVFEPRAAHPPTVVDDPALARTVIRNLKLLDGRVEETQALVERLHNPNRHQIVAFGLRSGPDPTAFTSWIYVIGLAVREKFRAGRGHDFLATSTSGPFRSALQGVTAAISSPVRPATIPFSHSKLTHLMKPVLCDEIQPAAWIVALSPASPAKETAYKDACIAIASAQRVALTCIPTTFPRDIDEPQHSRTPSTAVPPPAPIPLARVHPEPAAVKANANINQPKTPTPAAQRHRSEKPQSSASANTGCEVEASAVPSVPPPSAPPQAPPQRGTNDEAARVAAEFAAYREAMEPALRRLRHDADRRAQLNVELEKQLRNSERTAKRLEGEVALLQRELRSVTLRCDEATRELGVAWERAEALEVTLNNVPVVPSKPARRHADVQTSMSLFDLETLEADVQVKATQDRVLQSRIRELEANLRASRQALADQEQATSATMEQVRSLERELRLSREVDEVKVPPPPVLSRSTAAVQVGFTAELEEAAARSRVTRPVEQSAASMPRSRGSPDRTRDKLDVPPPPRGGGSTLSTGSGRGIVGNFRFTDDEFRRVEEAVRTRYDKQKEHSA